MKLADWVPGAHKEQLQDAVIIASSAVLVTVHRYFGSIAFAQDTFGTSVVNPTTYMFLTTFVLFGVLPALYLGFGARKSLRDYGLQIGDWRAGIACVAILYPIICLTMLYPGSLTYGVRHFYPLDSEAGTSIGRFLWFQVVRGVFFYSAWEFFFRGFMLFGLRKRLGDWVAICIQVVPSALWHIDLPVAETFTSIVGGVLFALIALRTRSVLWPFLLHCLIGVGFDILVIIR